MENLNTSIWENKINELQKLVAQFDTESFAGFFAYFIKNQPDAMTGSDLNKFESKLKDYLYLIALNVFAADKGNALIESDVNLIETLANKLYEIKAFNKKSFTEYSTDSVIHEMAFNNHFDNGVLSYVEQDLEKIRRVFTPFEEEIISDFGFDVDFLINVFKEIELLAVLRYKYLMEFSETKEFREFVAFKSFSN